MFIINSAHSSGILLITLHWIQKFLFLQEHSRNEPGNAEVLVQSAVSQERESRFTTISVYMDWLDSNFKKRKGRLEEGSTSRLRIF